MPESNLTLIAIDVDGVLNSFTKRPRTPFAKAEVGRWTIRWRQPVLDRIKVLLALPGVEGAWLTTWLEEPWLLDDLEQALGLEVLVPHRAEYPTVSTQTGGMIYNELFEGYDSFSPSSSRWWKLRALEMLLDRLRPARFAWLDDELGRTEHVLGNAWRPGMSSERFLLRTQPIAGLLPANMDRLERWVKTTTELTGSNSA